MKSRLISFPRLPGQLAGRAGAVSARLSEDLVALSAARAAFFLLTSAVPFLSLAAALTGFLLPDPLPETALPEVLAKGSAGELFRLLASQIAEPPGVPLLSFTAAATLWTSSRGISAIRDGVDVIYGCRGSRGAFLSRLGAVPLTLATLAAVTGSSLLLFFGGSLLSLMGGDSLAGRASRAMARALGLPCLFLLLSAVFLLLFVSAGRKSPILPRHASAHLPGALLAASGWILFSLLYSLYIAHVPRASAVYGGLGALSLVMLWLYFCMLILLSGAEVNRMLAERRQG